MIKYRSIPGFDLMDAKGNRALAEASLALKDAIIILMGEKSETGSGSIRSNQNPE
jgi:hypothetical protein